MLFTVQSELIWPQTEMASEETPLLPMVRSCTRKTKHSNCCFTTSCCIGSKAARLILLWNFAVLLAYKLFYDINVYFQVRHQALLPILLPIISTFIAVFSPVAGLLTDIRFSRVKAVRCTSYAILVMALVTFVAIILLSIFDYGLPRQKRTVIFITIWSILAIMVIVYVVFIINGIQFGMDQLHDSTTEDSILYIHWYVWIYYTCSLIIQIPWNFSINGYYENVIFFRMFLAGSILIITIVIFLLIVSLCVVHNRKVFFF